MITLRDSAKFLNRHIEFVVIVDKVYLWIPRNNIQKKFWLN